MTALLTLTLSGCAALEARAYRAATVQGQVQARVQLPEPPEDCTRTEPHADLIVGRSKLTTLDRERAALDRQNARTLRCFGPSGWYADLQKGMAQ